MLPWLTERFGNPSGAHQVARAARAAVDEARDVIAAALGVAPGWRRLHRRRHRGRQPGGPRRRRARPDRARWSARRSSTTPCCTPLRRRPASGPRDPHRSRSARDGIIDLDAPGRPRWTEASRVVSVMLVNNEVGTIQPLDEVGASGPARRAPNAVLHTDAVQAFPWLDVATLAGPGRSDLGERPQVRRSPGGRGPGRSGRHRPRSRSSTVAARSATAVREPTTWRASSAWPPPWRPRSPIGRASAARVGALRDRLVDQPARHRAAGRPRPASRGRKIPGNCHVCFEGVESEALLLLLDDAGVCASAGSACTSGAMEASHVLIAMGVPKQTALGSLRLSLGPGTSDADVRPRPQGRYPTRSSRLRRRPSVRVLVAMSGGVDSSVAAALLNDEGHEVVGATMKLWGGDSDSGCCSVADVDDARRVAQQLGIAHHVFNFTEDFDRDVVAPYVADHAAGVTPNPCVACNRHLKFDRFLHRAAQLGFDAVATGHHARIVPVGQGRLPAADGVPTGPRTSPTWSTC